MRSYKPRTAEFLRIHEIEGWRIKVYTLTHKEFFTSHEILENALASLPVWLQNSRNYDLPDYRIGCLIVHEGNEGVFCILNWWTGENMLQNHVYLATQERPDGFKPYSEGGIAFCVWELGIAWHERNAWVEHVLKHPDNPQFDAYLNDTFSGPI